MLLGHDGMTLFTLGTLGRCVFGVSHDIYYVLSRSLRDGGRIWP